MGKPQSKPTQEDLDKCEAKVSTLEDLVTHYKGGDHNSMESKQTNIGIFSLGVENNSNGSSNCSCTGFWGVLEVMAVIGISILVGFILFRCLMAYCARRRVIKAEEEQRR